MSRTSREKIQENRRVRKAYKRRMLADTERDSENLDVCVDCGDFGSYRSELDQVMCSDCYSKIPNRECPHMVMNRQGRFNYI